MSQVGKMTSVRQNFSTKFLECFVNFAIWVGAFMWNWATWSIFLRSRQTTSSIVEINRRAVTECSGDILSIYQPLQYSQLHSNSFQTLLFRLFYWTIRQVSRQAPTTATFSWVSHPRNLRQAKNCSHFVENRKYTTFLMKKDRHRSLGLAEFLRSGNLPLVVVPRINGLLNNFVWQPTHRANPVPSEVNEQFWPPVGNEIPLMWTQKQRQAFAYSCV